MMQGATLADDHLLQMKGGEWVSVAALLDAGEMHDRLSMPDPIEGIEYGRDKATLMTKPRPNYPREKPRLISHAHGVTTVYKFARYEPAPAPPFYPTPQGDRAANIAAHGDAVRCFMRAHIVPLRASNAVQAHYEGIDKDDPNKRALQMAARAAVQREMGLDYHKRPLNPPLKITVASSSRA